MDLTISPNMNTKKHPSFGLVSIIKPGNGWVISIEKNREPGEVYVEGFKSFVSVYERSVANQVRDLGEAVLKPKYFGEFKKKLLFLLSVVKLERPLFYKENGQEIIAMLDNPSLDFKATSDELIFGDLYK